MEPIYFESTWRPAHSTDCSVDSRVVTERLHLVSGPISTKESDMMLMVTFSYKKVVILG